MADRVTAEEVEAILDYDSDIDLAAFITAANVLVTAVCTDSGYADDLLKEVERWLSAHFYTIDDQHAAELEGQSAKTKYQYKVDLALNQTKYGQQAMILDYEGNLAQVNKRVVDGEKSSVSIGWLGTSVTTDLDS